MQQSVVITTIFEASEAVRAYGRLSECSLIVVGDEKTPAGWSCAGAEYLSLDVQAEVGPALAASLPHNHYCRKMFGYLLAAGQGAEVLIDTDDDNLPKDNWGFPAFDGRFETVAGGPGFVNIYQWFTDAAIWPRGLPLELISARHDTAGELSARPCNVGIWQGLADGDPDVDAIYRLTSNVPCFFTERAPLVLPEGAVCPFNSQNTATRRALFPLLYLPAHVSFRFTDILRGLVAQPIMWLYGYKLGFTQATVLQERNPHDYMKDFKSEIPMYLDGRRVVEIVAAAISARESLESNLLNAYAALLGEGIVSVEEMYTLEAWLKDLGRVWTPGRESADAVPSPTLCEAAAS